MQSEEADTGASFQVFAKSAWSSTVTGVSTSKDEHVWELKERICAKLGAQGEGVALRVGGDILLDKALLAAYEVGADCTVELVGALKGGMQLTVKTLSGRQQNFSFDKTTLVSEVKHALQEKEGIQVDQIRLIFSGRQLADDKKLEDYNVTPGATIHMVLQLRGGCAM